MVPVIVSSGVRAMPAEQTNEERLADRRRLEACARWLDAQAGPARSNGLPLEAMRLAKSAEDCRLRQR
jgi:hypothetical protein